MKNDIDKEKIKNKEKDKDKDSIKQNDFERIYIDLESDPQYKRTPQSLQPQESENSINNNIENNNNKINSSLKNTINKKNKYVKNSPNSKEMIYQKPKLFENSVKRDKKTFLVNNNKPMTTKRTAKKINYIQRNITPKKGINKANNKSENISSMNDKHIYSMRNKNIFKSGYASINREKTQKLITRPIETSPAANYNSHMNNINNDIYLNILKKKNFAKKLQTQRPDSATPLKKLTKLSDNESNLLEKNMTEINLVNDTNLSIDKTNNNINMNKEISNRENMVNMLINSYNKNISFNNFNHNISYNNKKINNSNYLERSMTTSNNTKNSLKYPKLNEADYEIKNPKKLKIKHPYNKIQSRDKQNYNKKRIINKNIIERDMTDPELLKMVNPIKINDPKREYQRTLNISLNNQENNTFLHQQKPNKMIRFNTNNNPRYNQYYSNNVNQSNPQILNNYVSINNLITPNYPVKVINVFGP